jgi:8-oxo-dGTP pyrophosphatase MutT (NUDIX family)
VNFDSVAVRLRTALDQSLPGPAAQSVMAPRPRREWPPGLNPARIRNAAGLLLVFPDEDQRAHLVLTLRADLVRHAGQVSLPGGVVEPGETFEQAALREAHEEVGLAIAQVQVLGALTPLDIPVSGFRLHPIVGMAVTRPLLRPADDEVARIVTPAVSELLDPRSIAWRTMTRAGETFDCPAFAVHDVEIWGATAMVLAEFLALLGWEGKSDGDR